MLEVAALIAAVAFAALVGVLVPVLLQIRRTAQESSLLLARLNMEIAPVLQEIRVTTGHVNALAAQAREGIQEASTLLQAFGQVGHTVQRARHLIAGRTDALRINLASAWAGMKAASAVIRERLRHREGNGHGDDA